MKKLILILIILTAFSFAAKAKRVYSETLSTVTSASVTTLTVSGYPTYYSFNAISGNAYISLTGATTTASIRTLDKVIAGTRYAPGVLFAVGDTITMISTDEQSTVYVLRTIE